MKISGNIFFFLPVTVAVLISSCRIREHDISDHRIIKDALGRDVIIPDPVRSAVALRSGALRLISYMDLTSGIGYVEGNEQRRSTPYNIANQRFKELKTIGTGNNFDTELLAAGKIDLIIASYMNAGEADKMEKLTGKPVFVLKYGNLDDQIGDFYNSLLLLGELFNRKGRADSLISYISEIIADCSIRTNDLFSSSVTAYIGGVAYSGSHGITSTVPSYSPFRMVSVKNAAGTLLSSAGTPRRSQGNKFIDPEQLIIWNPDYIFLDMSGSAIWREDLKKPAIARTLKAIKNKNVYTLLPYNWYTINYENILCNTWFIGKVVHPEAFEDIDIEQKCREIYAFFLGRDVFDEMKKLYDPFKKIL